jgi:hypothetical protein
LCGAAIFHRCNYADLRILKKKNHEDITQHQAYAQTLSRRLKKG